MTTGRINIRQEKLPYQIWSKYSRRKSTCMILIHSNERNSSAENIK